MSNESPLATTPTRWWLTLDAIIVFIFVIVGRDTHQESQSVLDIIETAAPFLWALLLGWLVARAWLDPVSARTGLVVTGVTIVGGMLLRRFVYSDGIATPFIVVTSIFFLATMLGWRAIVQVWWRRRNAKSGRAAAGDESAGTAAESDAAAG